MDVIFEAINSYIPADFILIIAGLIVIGEILKKFTTLPNQLLTTVLPILGAILTGTIYGTSTEVFEIAALIKQICVGLVIGWAATGGYEWFKNTITNKMSSIKKEITYQVEEEKVANEINE